MSLRTDVLPERYRDPERIARGGMGEVYRATDSVLGRTVAVKLLAERYATSDDVRGRFTREALAAARLSGQPNTVTIYDVGEWRERPFIVMEYLAGGSLEEVLRSDGAQSPERAFAWLEQAAVALDHAHAQGVVHRDVKPANLLLDQGGDVHVADFGIATAAGLESLTQTGTVLGTAGYLAPEQAEGKPTTSASDSYALGVVAFELLTGTRPFQNESITAEATAHVHAPVPSASERNADVPPEADDVFRRALAKDPKQRFSSCGELVAALRAAYDAAAGTTRIAAAPAPGVSRGRGTPWGALLAVLAALLLAGGILAAVLTTGGGHHPIASVHTVTTTPPATSASTPTTTATQGGSGAQLNNEGYAKMQAGDYRGALPLLQQAVRQLNGSGSRTEAYADYNLAYTIHQLGSCDRVLALLDRSQSIQGRRSEIDQLRAQCGGGPPGHPKHKKKKGKGD